MSFSSTYSGIVFTKALTASPQTFTLPVDYARGDTDTLIPALTGFQLYVSIPSGGAASASITWLLEHDDGGTWKTLANGTSTGTALDGDTWFSIYFTPVAINSGWLADSFRVTFTPSVGVGSPTRMRVLAASADSGTDFLGNVYRSLVTEASAASTLVGQGGFWLSQASPSQFAVESLYFDERAAGAPVVIDRVTLDPLTPGVYFQLYYSNDPAGPGTDIASWERLLWTPVYKTFQANRRDTYALPQPILARYVKVEFTQLQPRTYDAGNFEIPSTFKKHPKWVLDYFLARFAAQDHDLMSAGVAITYDALDLAFSYYKADLLQRPDPPALSLTPTSNQLRFFTQENATDVADPQTLAQIQLAFAPFLSQPALLGRLASILGDYAASTAAQSYPTEIIRTATADTTVVSNLLREPLLVEKGFPVMFFFVPCRHGYRISQATFEHGIGYYAGVKELTFHRDLYGDYTDAAQYNELLGDDANAVLNDDTQPPSLPRLPPPPPPPPVSGLIFFADGINIWTIRPDGSALTQIVAGSAPTGIEWSWVSASPDGTTLLAFDQNFGKLYAMNADGSARRQITNVAANAQLTIPATFSPSGSQAVLPYGTSSPVGACIVNIDNSGFTDVPVATIARGDNNVIYWSPDGLKFAFPDITRGVSVCNIDGSGTTTILEGGGSTSYGVYGWYPDNVNLLVNQTISTGTFPITVLKANGIASTTLYTDATETHFAGWCQGLSPDGMKVVVYDNATNGLSLLSGGTVSILETPPPNVNVSFVQWIAT